MNSTLCKACLLMLAGQAFILSSLIGCSKDLQGQAYADIASQIAEATNSIQNYVDSDRLQGAALLLAKDNQLLYEGSFGKYSPNTVVPIASASKWLSAAVLMTLVDDGAIALDDRVFQYLPNFTGEKGSITIRQLLSHTSGLSSKHSCLNDRAITLAECVNQISQTQLLAYPGTEFRYGGVSFQVAGRVAEVASGKSWNTLFEEKIKTPLNMVNTSYGTTLNPRIAGGAISTISDYGNFLQMLLDGGVFKGSRVLSQVSIRDMEREQTDRAAIAFTPRMDIEGYGLGEWRDIVDANGNAIQLSSQGAFGFSPWIDRQRNLLGVFLVDDELRNVHDLVLELQQTVRDLVDAAATPYSQASVTAQ